MQKTRLNGQKKTFQIRYKMKKEDRAFFSFKFLCPDGTGGDGMREREGCAS